MATTAEHRIFPRFSKRELAYRQPMTKAAVERIRGVDSEYSIRSLVHRRLIVDLGRADAPGRPILYGTGFDFLERFGLTSLDQLPPLDAEVAARLVEAGAGADFGPGELGSVDLAPAGLGADGSKAGGEPETAVS